MNPINQALTIAGQIGDISNTDAPIFGPIRKFNQQTFGLPGYANNNLSQKERLMDLLSRSSFSGSIKTPKNIPAGLQGLKVPEYGLPRIDVSDLEGALDLVRSRRTAKQGYQAIQELIDTHAPNYSNLSNKNIVKVAQSLLDAHYGGGEKTPVINIKRFLK